MNWNDVNIQFGNILRKTREARGMSQKQFSEFVGISRAYYGRIERGEHSVTLERCHLISEALGISLSELFLDMP